MADRRDDREQIRGERRDPETERRIDRRADQYRGSDERGYGGGEHLGRDWESREPEGVERSGRGERLRSADEERFDRGGRGIEERLSRDWEERGFREAPRDHGERRFRDSGREREMRGPSDYERERAAPRRDLDREDLRASPSGAFHEELREEREWPRRYGDRSRPTRLPSDTDRWSAGTYGLGAGEPGYGRDADRYGGDVGRAGPERGRYGFGTRGFGEVTDREGRHRHYSLAGLHDLDDMSELRERYRERHRHLDHAPHYGHGPGIENMEPPRLGYGTSMSRRGNTDHELGHGGYIGDVHREGPPRPRGRPPKGYQRSDTRIREDICDRLMTSWMNAENVDVQVKDGEVTLLGTVKSRDEKRAIEALAESVLGVKDITNTLRVERAEQAQEQRTQEQTSVQQPGDTPLHS